ncbi:uncharacterized protein [Halyomorpha halys]|uniref:uncharacterized protein n=1 Tax=Halyomorpha halys TaxID=286706 RepID=UPI0006D500DA|nr:uncharacterized protein LOC106688408 [Halyomorpha halys]
MEEVEIDLDELEKEKANNYFNFAFEMFRDVEPGFLESKCIQFAFDQEGFNNFLVETMLQYKYPKQQPCSSHTSVEKNNAFSVETFVKKYPDPQKYFLESNNGLEFIPHSISFLLDRFKFIAVSEIRSVLRKNNFKLFSSHEELQKAKKSRKTPRHQNEILKPIGEPPSVFYDEVNFIINKNNILKYLEDKRQAREAAVAEAKNNGTLLSCGCCFSDDLLAEDVVTCSEGHIFCRDCVKKCTEVLMGEGKIDFPCLEDCGAFFDQKTLKDVMENKIF